MFFYAAMLMFVSPVQIEHHALDVEIPAMQRALPPPQLPCLHFRIEASVKSGAVTASPALLLFRIIALATLADDIVDSSAEFLFHLSADFFK